jgi:prepilin-type N-terminal cleavage/methylation domain-containing protein
MRNLGNKGYTLVEVTIALTVTSILFLAIINFMTNTMAQYAAASARSELLSEAHTAVDIVVNDVRLSASAEETNRWPDDNAPGGEFGWESDSNTLVLATAAEDSNRDILFDDPAEYISYKNNVIYFLSNDSLYKRVLAAPVAGNSEETTCPEAQASASCPADNVMLRNISSFNVKYLDGAENEVTPSNARSIEVTIGRYTEEYSRPISVSYTTRMVFRND